MNDQSNRRWIVLTDSGPRFELWPTADADKARAHYEKRAAEKTTRMCVLAEVVAATDEGGGR